jgi:predicted DNA-binding protein with PD1-like motif
MKSKLLNTAPERTYALVFATGDEVAQGLLAFAQKEQLSAARLTGLGAFSDVTLGYFEWEKKEYRRIPIEAQVEVVSLIGDIALDVKGNPKLHAHVTVAKSDATAWGGHLLEAHVRPTLEVLLIESPSHLTRKSDPETGLALLDV